MSRNKSRKPKPEEPRVLKARHKRDYLARIKMVCDSLGGPGWFELIPKEDLDIIYEKRYPPLTVKLAPGMAIGQPRWERYRQIFQSLLDFPSALSGTIEIPFKIMLCEGLSLLHFIAMMAQYRFPRSEELRQAFRPYLITERSRYQQLKDEMSQLLFAMDVRNGNYHEGFLSADATKTNLDIVGAADNAIFIQLNKPVVSSVTINGRKRDIVALQRPVPHGKTIQVSFKPSAIGLVAAIDNELPVYLQRHALHRLDERLGLQAENVHSHLFFSLFNQPVDYVKGTDHSLIAFYMYEHKVGYLLTTLHEDKLVIRSFLFLTNDGTPEGKKLRQLTRLEKFDKKYLGIDKLSTFTAYGIDQDEELSAIFRKAGCGPLLEARYLRAIALAYTPPRDKGTLHKYLNHHD